MCRYAHGVQRPRDDIRITLHGSSSLGPGHVRSVYDQWRVRRSQKYTPFVPLLGVSSFFLEQPGISSISVEKVKIICLLPHVYVMSFLTGPLKFSGVKGLVEQKVLAGPS